MKYVLFFLLLPLATFAQDEPKQERRVIVLEKTDRTVTTPSKKPPFQREIEEDIEVMKNGEETKVRIKTIENGKVTVREYDSLDSLPEDVNVWIDEQSNGKQVRVRVLSDTDRQVLKEGDELPAGVRKMLEDEGIDLEEVDGKEVRIIRMEREEERDVSNDAPTALAANPGALPVETLNIDLNAGAQGTRLTVAATVPAMPTTFTVIGADGTAIFSKNYTPDFDGQLNEEIVFPAGTTHRNATLFIRQGSRVFTEVLR